MQNTSKALHGPVGLSLEVCGQFIANFSYKQNHTKQHVYVVKGLKNNNLLELPAILSLNLAARVQQIGENITTVQDEFQNLFCGLGKIGKECEIRLKDSVKPYAFCTTRNVLLPTAHQGPSKP